MTDIFNSITVEQIKALADDGFCFTIENGRMTGIFAEEKIAKLKERRAEANKRYFSTENGRKHLKKGPR